MGPCIPFTSALRLEWTPQVAEFEDLDRAPKGARAAAPARMLAGYEVRSDSSNKVPPSRGVQRNTRILQISEDPALGLSRQFILRLAGCSTVTVTSHTSIEEHELAQYDVAIICQSVCANDALSIAACLRNAAPALRLLRIVLLPEENRSCFDVILPAPVRPGILQAQVQELARQICSAAPLATLETAI